MALSDLAVRQARATGKAYTLADSDGLALAVTATGGKSWHFRYYWLDRQRRISLGTYPEISLREARALRDEARALLARGINPQLDRKQKRNAARLADVTTFNAVYDRWVRHRERALTEGRQTTLTQIRRVFKKDILPALGKRPIHEIRRTDLVDVVERIERRKAFTQAEKVRTWLNQLFRFALVLMPELASNPAFDLDVVAAPQPPVRHNPFLRMGELPAFLKILRNYPGRLQTQLGLRFLLLTGVRTGELRYATPDQFDLARGLWIIPAAVVKQLQLQIRKKGKQPEDIPPYIVPLSVQAMEIVRHMLSGFSPAQHYLFAHQSNLTKRMSENTLNAALKRIGYKDQLTGHGIRGTISTALREIGYPKAWVEAQLSHADPDKVSAAYNHAEYVEQRRRMMQDWADRLDLFEQNRVKEASRHLTVHLEGVVLMDEDGAQGASPSTVPSEPGWEVPAAPAFAGRLPAVILPRDELQPELSDIQRERLEVLSIYNSPNTLTAAMFARAVGKSRRWITYEIQAGKVLALSMGNRGHRIPDWHLDPLKHRLIQAVLKEAGDADAWRVYRALARPHARLGGRAPIEAVTQDNFDEGVTAACFALQAGGGQPTLPVA
ncbi:integrase arm-type DNA-binding domain-containing protein [Xanthobacter autotrophicus]|uniref:tyrosine-type recombinase/integrase n=1 Tax=Xanthobacter autotrophicus TaxID=280 RepID=UPI0037279195